jgi:hypothetical protein
MGGADAINCKSNFATPVCCLYALAMFGPNRTYLNENGGGSISPIASWADQEDFLGD